MYIPRPAKLLFTIDDGWNKFLEKFSDRVTPWTRLCVERMLACGTAAMGVKRYCCASPDCTHSRFFCQTCKSKGCSSCGHKATEQWITEQQHILPDCDWQHITFTMPHRARARTGGAKRRRPPQRSEDEESITALAVIIPLTAKPNQTI